mmetsp:Transcript_9288/g.16403  ORF Transcript_9288/g.16403 Transcript_9288/m.16403 type:complete len:307 (+) Transcript_9288:2-922(+)
MNSHRTPGMIGSVFLLAFTSCSLAAELNCRAAEDDLSVSLLQGQLSLGASGENFEKGSLQDVIAKARELKHRALLEAEYQALEREQWQKSLAADAQRSSTDSQSQGSISTDSLNKLHEHEQMSELQREIQQLERELDNEEAAVRSDPSAGTVWMQLSTWTGKLRSWKGGATRDVLIVVALGIIPLLVILSVNANSVFFPIAILFLVLSQLWALSHMSSSDSITLYLLIAGIMSCIFTMYRGYNRYHSGGSSGFDSDSGGTQFDTLEEKMAKVSGRFDRLEGMIKAGFGSALREEEELLSKMRTAFK